MSQPITGMKNWNNPNKNANVTFRPFSPTGIDKPLPIDTPKASMARPTLINIISNTDTILTYNKLLTYSATAINEYPSRLICGFTTIEILRPIESPNSSRTAFVKYWATSG